SANFSALSVRSMNSAMSLSSESGGHASGKVEAATSAMLSASQMPADSMETASSSDDADMSPVKHPDPTRRRTGRDTTSEMAEPQPWMGGHGWGSIPSGGWHVPDYLRDSSGSNRSGHVCITPGRRRFLLRMAIPATVSRYEARTR